MSLPQAKALLARDPASALQLAQRAGPGLEARFVLAAAKRRCGDPEGALEALDGIDRSKAWGIAYEQGAAFAMLGRHADAAEALGLAHCLNPESAVATHALVGELALAGCTVPDALARRCAALVGHEGPAAHALQSGSLPPAIDLHDACWLRLLADAALLLGLEDRAEELLADALRLGPAFDAAAFDLAVLFERQQRGPEAVDIAAPLAERHPDIASVHALLSAAHLHCGSAEAALAASDAALALESATAALWHARGHALRMAGQGDEAVAAYRRSLDLAPCMAEPWWSLANLKTYRFNEADLARMQARLAQASGPQEEAHLRFALGRAAFDAGDAEAAMAHLAAANAIRRAQAPFDMAGHAAFVDRSIQRLNTQFFASREGWGDPTPGPILVLGLPRAGSTLVEQILASHPQVEGLSELPDLTLLARKFTRRLIAQGRATDRVSALEAMTAQEAQALGADYLARIAPRRSGAPLFVDKAPGNLFNVALIRLALLGVRIVVAAREAMACCFSLWTQDFAAGQGYSHDLRDLGRYYRLAESLSAHWSATLPDQVLHLQYEALVDDLEGQVRRLLDHCGLPFDPACLRFYENPRVVRTISSEQVRQPLHRQGLDRWRAASPWLGPLEEALSQHPFGQP